MTHFERIQAIAKDHRSTAVRSFHASHRHAKKLLRKHSLVLRTIRQHAIRTAAVASVSAGILAAPVLAAHTPQDQNPYPKGDARALQRSLNPGSDTSGLQITLGPSADLADQTAMVPSKFKDIAPEYTPNMSLEQEAAAAALIQAQYGIPVAAELNGIRLNATQGIIAGEQHLPLFPGDTLASHDSDPTKHLTGMVPGNPSWGYFAKSKAEVTKEDIENERYYIAAQTFLAPGWGEHVEEYYQWFKYRKMFVVNPETGQAVVVDIADAGPSPRTGRTFGGSNEVLMGLGLGKKRTGHVYVFFVDDPTNSIRLGPLGRSE